MNLLDLFTAILIIIQLNNNLSVNSFYVNRNFFICGYFFTLRQSSVHGFEPLEISPGVLDFKAPHGFQKEFIDFVP